jgi:hypothetical protein
VVCNEISLLDMTKFLSKHELLGFQTKFDPEEGQDINAHPEKIMGKLIALEIPSYTHDGAAATDDTTDKIKASVRSIVDEQQLRSWASPICRIGARLKEPDSGIGPRGHKSETTTRKATIVAEIVYLHGTREDLKQLLSTWISPESKMRIAIVIKIIAF